MQEFSYAYLGFQQDGSAPAPGRWAEGSSIDGEGTFTTMPLVPMGEKPVLGPAKPNSGAQSEQM
jgi:Mn-containing catalase